MENETKNTEPENNQPKPTDDAQLEIETVVPSTHEKKVNDATDQPADSGQSAQKTSEAEPSQEEETPAENTETTSDDPSDAPDNDASEDERDQIETITPSA